MLEHPIAGSAHTDARGPYPLFQCADWGRLENDLADPPRPWVTLTLVLDPFADLDAHTSRSLFPDLAIPFKTHYIVDLSGDPHRGMSAHHRRYTRRAQAAVEVERVRPAEAGADWVRLYAGLAAHRGLRGESDLSPESLRAQLAVTGAEILRARAAGETVAMSVWYRQGQIAYYHLGASSPEGYHLQASFALFWEALTGFAAAGVEQVDLGGVPGAGDDPNHGLARFKRGWATGTWDAWLCGRIFDREAYRDCVAAAGTPATGWFPAYRSAEGDWAQTVREPSP